MQDETAADTAERETKEIAQHLADVAGGTVDKCGVYGAIIRYDEHTAIGPTALSEMASNGYHIERVDYRRNTIRIGRDGEN